MASTHDTGWDYARRIAYPNITEVALSPDGQHLVYAVREPLHAVEKSAYITHLYQVTTPQGEPRRLTFGEYANGSPRWSPDGRYLAFLSNRDGKANVYAMCVGDGDAWPLTNYQETNVTALRWAPDGASLAFLMNELPPERTRTRRRAGDDAIRWDQDFDFAHLFIVPFAARPRKRGEARQITRGRYTIVDFEWLTDGTSIAVTHRPSPFNDCWPDTRLGIIPIDGSFAGPRDLGLIAAFGGRPAVSPDGAWIACCTGGLPAHWAFAGRVVLYSTKGGEPRPLARTPDEQPDVVGWSSDGREVYVAESRGMTRLLYALPASGGAARPLMTDQILAESATANRADAIAFVGQDLDRPHALYVLNARSGEVQLVAQPTLPPEWPDGPLARTEVVRWQASPGSEIEGLLTYPLGYLAGQRCPLVVQCHGGPKRTFLGSPGYFVDQMDLAARGYAILRPNPRGSSGYGRDFRFAIYDEWGADVQDVLAGVEHLVASGVADPDRLGIAGWSIWGYLAACAITQTNRFKAACVGGGFANLASLSGTSDSPSLLPDCLGAQPWEDPETYRRHSPVFNAARIHTPTLILHGEHDARVPLGQARELYNALKHQGVPVELAIYPRQGHVIDQPRLLIDLQHRTANWFDQWMR